MPEEKDVIAALTERIPPMLDLMPGSTRVEQLAAFLVLLGGGAKVGKVGFVQACNIAIERLEEGQHVTKAKKAQDN